jgi:hypothetical protein
MKSLTEVPSAVDGKFNRSASPAAYSTFIGPISYGNDDFVRNI